MVEQTITNTAVETVESIPHVWPYVWTIVLASWGGAVRHIQVNRKTGNWFNWKEFLVDIVVSSFAGLLTYFFCEAANLQGPTSALMIAISGHMGPRAISSLQTVYERILGTKNV